MGDVLAQFKNRSNVNLLINGAFEFDQEKEGGAYTVNGAYCLDQWILGDTLSCLRASVVTNPYGYVLRSTATAQQNRFIQRIEQKAVKHLKVGSKITFSVYAQVTSGSWSVNPIKVRIDSANALDNFAGVTTQSFDDMSAVTGSNIPDGTRRRFYHSITVTQPMIDYGFQLVFGDFTNATNIVEYSMAMLNEGSHRAPFSRAGITYSGEREKCGYFYQKTYQDGTPVGALTTEGSYVELLYVNSAIYRRQITFPVLMRTSAVVTTYSPSNGAAGFIDFNGSPIASSLLNAYADRAFFGVSGGINPLTTYDTRLHFTANARL